MAQLKSLIVNGVSRFNNTTYSNIAYNDTTYSTNGFVKVGFDNTNVLLAGGGTRSLDWFAHEHDHPYLPLAGGTMTGAIDVSFTSDASWDPHFGLNFGRDGTTGHIGNDDNDLALYARKGIELYVGETDLPDRVSRSYGLKITNSNLLYSSQNGTDQKVWHAGNDGSGSGLDADLLDGQHGDYYAKSSWMASYLALSGGVMTGAITSSVGSSMIDKTKGINFGTASSYGAHLGYNGGNFGIFSANKIFIVPGANVNEGTQPTNSGLELTTTTIKFNNQKVWWEGNDGHESGLDADLLDGKHATYFAPIASPTLTGTPKAPTASAGTNNTQIATTAFVTTAVSIAVGQRPTYTIKKLDSPTANSYVASYKLYSVLNNNETPIGDTINIPKDYLVRRGEIKTVETANTPYTGAAVGDKYLDFEVNTSGDNGTTTHIYIPVKDLVDIYEGGAAISVSGNNKISAYLNSSNSHGLEITASGIGLNLASSSSDGAMSSSTYNKLWNEDFHDYLPLAGGVMTGAITSSVGTSIGDKTKGINFGTASSYGGHIGYVNSGAMGMYAKDKITIVPGVDINAQQNPANSGLELTTTAIKFNNQKVWWEGNDGHESGLDADTLDTYHGNDFLLKTGGTISGDLTIQGNTTIGDSVDDKLIINSTTYVKDCGNYDGTNENDPHTFSMQKLLTRTLYKKEYQGYTALTGDATHSNSTMYANGGYLFFMQVHPQSTNYFEPWHVKYRLYVNKVSGNNNDYCKGYYDCYISQEGATVIYAFFNEFYSTSYRPIYYHLLLSPDNSTKWGQRGYDSTTGLCSHPIWIGASMYSAFEPNKSHDYKIEVYEVHNCKITFPDTIQHYDKVKTGDSTYDDGIYSSTYYGTAKAYNGYSMGLQETSDDNTTSSTQLVYTQLLAGVNGIKQYSLVMQDNTGAWQSFTTSAGTGTSKPKNTSKFRLGSRIYYHNSSSNKNSGDYTGTSTIYQNIANCSFNYSINSALTTKKSLYIVGTVDAAKYFNLADVWWTQDEPTTEDGKVYIKVCESVYSSTSGDLLSDGKPMWFKDGLFRPYPESKPKFEEGTTQNTIKLVHGNETSDDFMIAYAVNADTLDGLHASDLATAHTHPYLPLAGGVLTGGVTVPAGTSMINKTMGINFGAANSYGGHLGYIQAGDLGIYTKRDIYLIPNSNVQGESGDNTKGLKLSSSAITFNSKKVWWEGNDGHESGLDADLLDGIHATELLTNVEMYAGGNSTKIDVTVGGTTLTGSLIVPYASNAGNVDWENISNLPEVFPAAPHNHDADYVNVTGDTMSGALTINNNLTVTGNATLGDSASDRHKINGITTSYNDVILYSASGDSPSLVFNRAGSSLSDWKMYVKSGNLYFASATNAATWTDRVYIQDQSNKIHAYFVGDLHGHVQGNVTGNLTGNADTATKLKTARTISISGAVTGSGSFDGSANLTISTSVNHQHNYAGSSTYGGAANTVVVTDSNTNATYNMVFHNGSTLYSTTDVTCNPSTDELTAKIVRAKANDMYVGSAAGAQCHMQYDNTMKCIKFMFD